MNRLGFSPSESLKLLSYIQKHPHLKLKGLAGHLSDGELAGYEWAKAKQKGINFKKVLNQPNFEKDFLSQTGLEKGEAFKTFPNIKKNLNMKTWEKNNINLRALPFMLTFIKLSRFFQKALPHQKLETHLLNSAGWLSLWGHSFKDTLFGFRPGICLYGVTQPLVWHLAKASKAYGALKLKPTSLLKSFVVSVHTLLAGESVSYGGVWRAKKKSHVAVVCMGYADGLPYSLSNKGEVLLRGKRVPIVGRICMDFFMIDVTHLVRKGGAIKPGEEVVIFGEQKKAFISLEEQAHKAHSIPYELLTRIGPRVKRIYT